MRILLLADYAPGNASAVADFLYAFDRHSKHKYFFSLNPGKLDRSIDIDSFDAVVISWAVWFAPPPPFESTFPEWLVEKLRRSEALKILFLQDEYAGVRRTNAAMAECNIHLMFTNAKETDHEIFYPRALIPSLREAHTVLTGYVPEYLERGSLRLSASPQIDIGYRSREVPFHLGDLGREKVLIAGRFQEFGQKYGFTTNISVRESDRIYGRAWIDFLRSTRFQLGTPSGASVVDFTGEIAERSKTFLRKHPAASYEEVRRRFFADCDGKVVIDPISPRIFEYAAVGNVMVLGEGHYHGILLPDTHYISIKNDLSNVDDVVDRMRSARFCETLVRNSREDLIESGTYSYKAFVKRFDKIIERHLPKAKSIVAPSRAKFYLERWRESGQYSFPLWGREIIVPIGGGAVYWYRKLGAALLFRTPLIGKSLRVRGGTPQHRVWKGLVALSYVLRSSTSRHLWLRSYFRATLRARVSAYGLLKELALLRAIADGHRDRQPLARHYVLPEIHADEFWLNLRSYGRAARPNRLRIWRTHQCGSFRERLKQALLTDRVRSISWHIPRYAPGVILGTGKFSAFFPRESQGIFWFRQIQQLLALEPQLTVELLVRTFERSRRFKPHVRKRLKLLRFGRQVKFAWGAPFRLARKLPLGCALISSRPARLLLLHTLKRLIFFASLPSRGWLHEIMLLSVLSRIQAGRAFTDQSFHIEVESDRTKREVRLVSRRGPATGDISAQLNQACDILKTPPTALVMWDHRAIGPNLTWRLPGYPRYESRVGEEGILALENFSQLPASYLIATIAAIAS
jgi:hypothetical protein